MKIGLYGGTFDPVHRGHLHLAEQVHRHHNLDLILWVPAFSPPHKLGERISPFEHRFKMLELATKDLKGHIASNLEAKRSGPSYTVDTLSILREQYPNATFFLLMGSDMSASFSSWRNWEQILNWATPIILVRQGMEVTLDLKLPVEVSLLMKQSTLPIETLPISSTQVRNERKKGKSLDSFVLPKVEEYIQKVGLYS